MFRPVPASHTFTISRPVPAVAGPAGSTSSAARIAVGPAGQFNRGSFFVNI